MNEMYLAAAAVVVAYAGLCWVFLFPRGTKAARSAATEAPEQTLLIGYASQSGQAEQLARQCATQLQPHQPVQPLALNQIGPQQLANARLALFFVSTYGEGEPPDNALRFARKWLHHSSGSELKSLRTAVLALGDSRYRKFCGFGQQLDEGLKRHGATPLFAPVTVDKRCPEALRLWQKQLDAYGLAYDTGTPAFDTDFSNSELLERTCLNPGSAGDPVWLIRLRPPAGAHWQAGDILQIQPHNSPTLPMREYSIASIMSAGSLDLLVRQVQKGAGEYGLGSGWLTAIAQRGEALNVRIRENPAFHAPAPQTPLVLIGNGTGMAGLHALMQERVAAGARRNLLFFGERNRAVDYFFRERIEHWRQQGFLQGVHLAFSRDQPNKIYVQDRLKEQAETLTAMIDDGGALFVCGSLEGMAGAVHQTLETLIGGDRLEQMTLDGRYRRDVY